MKIKFFGFKTSNTIDWGQKALNNLQSKNDKGIEMENDFNAETFELTQDSEDDDNDEGEPNKAMRETGENGEVADELLGVKMMNVIKITNRKSRKQDHL